MESVGACSAYLTPTQRTVLALLLRGQSQPRIGRALCLSQGGVAYHVKQLYRQLGVSGRAALCEVAIKRGWLAVRVGEAEG